MVKEINESNFNEVTSSDIALVDFWAQWCNPCKMVAPIVEEVAQDLNGKVNFFKVDIDSNNALAAKYKITSIPALLIFKNGELVETSIGFKPKAALQEIIQKHV